MSVRRLLSEEGTRQKDSAKKGAGRFCKKGSKIKSNLSKRKRGNYIGNFISFGTGRRGDSGEQVNVKWSKGRVSAWEEQVEVEFSKEFSFVNSREIT